jgi:hypothetical protein
MALLLHPPGIRKPQGLGLAVPPLLQPEEAASAAMHRCNQPVRRCTRQCVRSLMDIPWRRAY